MLPYLFGRFLMVKFLMNIWDFIKERPIVIPIAALLLTILTLLMKSFIGILRMILKRITKRIIEHKAIETGISLLREIANEFHETQKVKRSGMGPEFVYDDSMQLIEVKPEETPYKQQSFAIHFDKIEKVYHRTWITRILGIDEEIKERCFEKLLKSSKLHEGKEKHTFIFKRTDNLDLLDKKR